MMNKNAFRLVGHARRKGYDWWWHSLVAKHSVTGELQPFFIEYYIINPGLWKGKMIFGQDENSGNSSKKPCYAMIKAGTWGYRKCQLHQFYGFDQVSVSKTELDCKIGPNKLSETMLSGEIAVDKESSIRHPEHMTDAGTMKWDLQVEKNLTFDLGYGTSDLFNRLNAFQMYWHVQGMRSRFTGNIVLNGENYLVEPDSSFGYQDKNWGSDYTNPWIWLNCNNFTSTNTQQPVDASLVIGGGCPVVVGIALKHRIISAFYYHKRLYEFNFSKFWKQSSQHFKATSDSKNIYWHIETRNREIALEIDFKCPKDKMLWVNYENPNGEKNHTELWNGGHANGTVKIFQLRPEKKLLDTLNGSFGGCEYGDY